MLLCHHSLHQILHYVVVFILACTIIGIEEDVLSETMVVKEVQPTDHSLGTIACFICQEVYFSGECFTCHAEHCTLPWCHELGRPRLQGIRWTGGVVHLDIIVVYEVWRRRSKLVIGDKVCADTLLALLTCCLVVCSLHFHQPQVIQSVADGCRLLGF